MIIDPLPTDHAAPFREVADKIALNAGQGFGGAFVIVPPDGDVQHALLLDNAQSAAIFWSILRTRADIALAEIEDQARGQASGFGRR